MRVVGTWLLAALLSLRCAADDTVPIPLPHDGAVLAGVLTLPAAGTARHGVLLLPPAGPADPDLSLGSRGIYRAAAKELAAAGVASLRISSRGVPPATGDWLQTGFDDRAADAVAAYDWLRSRSELAGAALAVAGLSEGGALALAVAGSRDSVAGLVLLSMPLGDGATTMRWQRDALLGGAALSDDQKSLMVRESDRLLEAVAAGDEAVVREVLSGPAGALVLPAYEMVPGELEQRIAFVLSPWYRSQLDYHVIDRLAGLRVPIFAAYGSLDQVIDGPGTAAQLRRQLAGNAGAEVQLVPDRNHLMMPAVTGSPGEYASLPDVIDAALWYSVGEWVKALEPDADPARPAERPRKPVAGDPGLP